MDEFVNGRVDLTFLTLLNEVDGDEKSHGGNYYNIRDRMVNNIMRI